MPRQRNWRAGAWFGILVPGLDALVNEVVAANQTDYAPLHDYISDLSAPEVAYSGLIRGWWLAFPFLFAPFLVALYANLRRHRFAWVVPGLLQLAVTALAFCGIFPCDAGCQGRTFSAQAHYICSDIVGAALVLSPFALWLTTRIDERWQRFQVLNLGFFLGGGLAGGALALAARGHFPLPGLCERIFYGVYYLWFILLAVRLLRSG
jgi:hypothetical membrane protein